jgi:hypothetical protein
MIRLFNALILVALGTAVPGSPPAAEEASRLRIVSGVTETGTATPLWLSMVRKRLSMADDEAIVTEQKPLSAEEHAWANLVRARGEHWPDEIPKLAALFEPVGTPKTVTIVLGNRGAADAFTHDAVTIGFDLSELQRSYGAATKADNAELMDRLFRHEFSHLLQKRWLAQHPWPTDSPLRTALFGIWAEGIGNYYSLSARWQPTPTGPSPATTAALADLEPRFVTSLVALACADSEAAAPLLASLSSGPFNKKWGALPAALWLQREAARDPAAVRRFAIGGPAAVWDLAARNLPTELAVTLAAVRQNPQPCAVIGAGHQKS